MNESLLLQSAIGLVTIAGSWAVMRTQMQRALEDIKDLRAIAAHKDELVGIGDELKLLHSLVMKLSLQIAYLNGQLSAKGLVPGSMPDPLKLP